MSKGAVPVGDSSTDVLLSSQAFGTENSGHDVECLAVEDELVS